MLGIFENLHLKAACCGVISTLLSYTLVKARACSLQVSRLSHVLLYLSCEIRLFSYFNLL